MNSTSSSNESPGLVCSDGNPDHVTGRAHMLRALSEELVGPAVKGPEIDLDAVITGQFPENFRRDGPYLQKGSGEEILCVEPPALRYGIGVLFPWGTTQESDGKDDSPAEPTLETTLATLNPLTTGAEQQSALTSHAQDSIRKIEGRNLSGSGEPQDDDYDLSSANMRRPNSMALSFLAKLSANDVMIVRATGGRYEQVKIPVDKNRQTTWWRRYAISIEVRFSGTRLLNNVKAARITAETVEASGLGPIDLHVEAFCRPTRDDGQRLITVCLINRTTAGRGIHGRSIFQSAFEVTFESVTGAHFLPYPKPVRKRLDDEEQSLEMLYRDFETFAIGHGGGADWEKLSATQTATKVRAVSLPAIETPSITPAVTRMDGTELEVQMAPLAGLVPDNDGAASLQEIVDSYANWISEREADVPRLGAEHSVAAQRHIEQCKNCLKRMHKGLAFLREDETAALAFRWANEAILAQQLRSSRIARSVDIQNGRIVFDSPYRDVDLSIPSSGRGKWRPFQIAFLLMSLRSAVISDDDKRETIDLIWFPTGGGKTEAYFGLAAFSAFYRRLSDPNDIGVHVLMRYTLRLLTAQQFQRASGLICAMEAIRRREEDRLKSEPFSIGIWLGGETTPNSRSEARSIARQLQRGDDYVINKLLVTKCPWCSAQLGPIKSKSRNAPKAVGYHDNGVTISLRCSDDRCVFHGGLPIFVIDEDIYERKPTLIIGTVDKFAMLAWRPGARALFGLDDEGTRVASPPGLIIQDELHLISGPLGSMTGLYESVIEELCTDGRSGEVVKPKIVCSTATIRRFRQQARALFGREDTALFPPPGLTVADSFFSSYAKNEDGSLSRGRIFVGVYAPALGSIQTAEVRTLTALLQAPCALPDKARDPWWTVLIFLNSLREIGTAATLFQSDIPDRLKVLRKRLGIDFKEIRRLYEIMELTSRLRSDDVPKAIEALEIVAEGRPKAGKYPVDACLASNIIEVGVDIDRLSLLVIVGQPKSTSQYIQVAGRVGRRPFERPGFVVTIFGPNNARDRSHYEKFRSYHERLYAQVEPTSVTPYSLPVLDRALHAVMASYIRQTCNQDLANSPRPVPEKELAELRSLLRKRVNIVDSQEIDTLDEKFGDRLREWRKWQRTEWRTSRVDGDVGLLTPAGSYLPAEDWEFTWPTPLSMRNVDAECATEITREYLTSDDIEKEEPDVE
ncbi:helicase-related protein [Reyranella sp. CPCC 100927]|uniref:helicase-related protein n=1 Tax=Reyranella sp. CPCC 100927 TaxID=2599616 RepID=UPI0011B5B31A|nr:helicase-related protein [Reyranella sp. CPCC 100927]TWT06137.1 helicase [Reyranella sp. CPCC 100927]